MRSLTQGAATILAGLLDPSIRSKAVHFPMCASELILPSGKAPVFLVENDILEALPYAHNPENEEMLWALSEKLVGEKFAI